MTLSAQQITRFHRDGFIVLDRFLEPEAAAAAAARFHPTEVSYIYSRYRRRDSLAMDEDFFPVLWHEDGFRTGWLDRGATETSAFGNTH